MNAKELTAKLKEAIVYGDIINTSYSPKWYDIGGQVLTQAIQGYQKRLFGSEATWTDTHTMIYLPGGIYSQESPVCRTWNIDEYFKHQEKETINLTLYRYQETEFKSSDINLMTFHADSLIGKKYDYGQLINILVNGMTGHPSEEKIKAFDLSAQRKVCSVYVAWVYNMWHIETGKRFPRIFKKLNKRYWNDKFLKNYDEKRGWNIENITPAHFANTNQFDFEFKKVFEIRKNNVIDVK